MILSDFDELFNNVSASAMSELVNSYVVLSSLRDSKIKLVTELDSEHPLKAGEYYYSEDENTLYVGAGVIESIKIGLTDFIQHHTNVKYIPAPRHATNLTVLTPVTIINTVTVAKPAPRINTHLATSVPNITYNTSVRKTNVFTLNTLLNHSLPTIEHNSLVD